MKALAFLSVILALGTGGASSADRKGLALEAKLTVTGSSLVVEARVTNHRSRPVYLDADQCGRVTEAVLARTRFEPKGARWSGSLQAVKRLVLRDQADRQAPDRFAPRIPGETTSSPPPCDRPTRPRKLAPGEQIAERWELPFSGAYALAAVGSAATVVRVEAVESRAPGELDYLDILPTGAAESLRAGRNVRLQVPVSRVLDRAPAAAPSAPSLGQLYDRLLKTRRLRSWIERQPAGSWRLAQLTPSEGRLRFRIVTTRYERAAEVAASAGGTDVTLSLPTQADRTRVFPRRPGTTPVGIKVIDEPKGYLLGRDVLTGTLSLPSGRVVAGEYLLDDKLLDLRVHPGRYPVYGTLAKPRHHNWQGVALATLVLSNTATVQWKPAGVIAVDGGSAGFSSPEGVALLRRSFDRDQDEWMREQDRIFDSQLAHDGLATNYTLGRNRNLVEFSSGVGDGRYPIYVGYDARGRPTRVVLDFYLLHLVWPR